MVEAGAADRLFFLLPKYLGWTFGQILSLFKLSKKTHKSCVRDNKGEGEISCEFPSFNSFSMKDFHLSESHSRRGNFLEFLRMPNHIFITLLWKSMPLHRKSNSGTTKNFQWECLVWGVWGCFYFIVLFKYFKNIFSVWSFFFFFKHLIWSEKSWMFGCDVWLRWIEAACGC